MWPLADILKEGMFLAGISLLALILLLRLYRRYGRRRGDGVAGFSSYRSEPTTTRPRSLSTAPSDVLRWQVELHDTAREMKAELDSKMRALQLLIRQAREEADRLERLLTRHDGASQRGAADSAPGPASGENSLADATWQHTEIYRLADQGLPAAAIAERLGRAVGDVELILSLRPDARRASDEA